MDENSGLLRTSRSLRRLVKCSFFTFGLVTALTVSAEQAVAPEPEKVEPKIEPEIKPEVKPEADPKVKPETDPKIKPEPKKEFVPDGSAACLVEQVDIDLFTKKKNIGHVGDNPKNAYRRLVQRTIMVTEPLPPCGAVLTFDDQIITKQEDHASAFDVAKDLQKLGVRAIFFANMPEMSAKELSSIMRSRRSNEGKLKRVQQLLDSKRDVFIKAVRGLLKMKSPKDKEGNQYYICEVFNHTAFHQDMSNLKVGTLKYKACIMGIEHLEKCIDEAYRLERPEYKRARYFRFPFLHSPKNADTKAALNAKFTELGIISLGETQDSKDVDNRSSTKAYDSLAAAKKNNRYSVKAGAYGKTDKPIALFHTRTWHKIKKGVLKSISEGKKTAKAEK